MLRHVTTRVSGLVIFIAGLWGGIIPFVGPYFHFTLGPDKAWTYTSGRLWLDILPAAAAVLGGLILMGGGPRLSGRFGALLALAGGVWFAIGPTVSMLWTHGAGAQGAPVGHHVVTRMLEYLTLHTGLGVLITAFAAYALPGVAAYTYRRHRVARDAAIAGTGAAVGAEEAHHRDRVAEREGAAAPREGAVATREGAVAEREGAVAEPIGAGARGNGVGAPARGEAAPAAGSGAAPAGEPAAAPAGEPAAAPAAAGPGATTDPTAVRQPVGVGGGPAYADRGQTQTTTRRRGGLFRRR